MGLTDGRCGFVVVVVAGRVGTLAKDLDGIGGGRFPSILGREVSCFRSVPLTLGRMGNRPLVFRRVGRGVSTLLSLLCNVSRTCL
jgi:hypothetical protein